VPSSPWGAAPALLVVVAACLLPLIIGFFVMLGVMLVTGGPGNIPDAKIEEMFSLGTLSGVATAAGTQLVSLALIWLAAGRARMRRAVLQLANATPRILTLLAAAAVLILVTSAFEYLMYLTTAFDIKADSQWLRVGLMSPYWWGTLLIGIVFAPLWEEFAFRGFLMSALAQTRLGVWGGGLISNTLWTLLHWGYSWQGLASVFMAGLVLTWILRRTGSIWAPVFAHAVSNAAALGFAYYMGS
jgi:hypothetical protein